MHRGDATFDGDARECRAPTLASKTPGDVCTIWGGPSSLAQFRFGAAGDLGPAACALSAMPRALSTLGRAPIVAQCSRSAQPHASISYVALRSARVDSRVYWVSGGVRALSRVGTRACWSVESFDHTETTLFVMVFVLGSARRSCIYSGREEHYNKYTAACTAIVRVGPLAASLFTRDSGPYLRSCVSASCSLNSAWHGSTTSDTKSAITFSLQSSNDQGFPMSIRLLCSLGHT